MEKKKRHQKAQVQHSNTVWKKVVRTAGTTPVAAVAAPLPRRPLSNEERHEIMRYGILARMKPNKNYGETAARLCQLHMEASNSVIRRTFLPWGVGKHQVWNHHPPLIRAQQLAAYRHSAFGERSCYTIMRFPRSKLDLTARSACLSVRLSAHCVCPSIPSVSSIPATYCVSPFRCSFCPSTAYTHWVCESRILRPILCLFRLSIYSVCLVYSGYILCTRYLRLDVPSVNMYVPFVNLVSYELPTAMEISRTKKKKKTPDNRKSWFRFPAIYSRWSGTCIEWNVSPNLRFPQ